VKPLKPVIKVGTVAQERLVPIRRWGKGKEEWAPG
jgi:hypothetical protein